MPRALRRYAVFSLMILIVFYLISSVYNDSPLDSIASFFGRPSKSKGMVSIDWKEIPERYPVESFIPLPTGTPQTIPRIQHDFKEPELIQHRRERLHRRYAIRQAFKHCWDSYRKYAWLHDEVKPVTGGFKDHFGGWGATLVDALDTLHLMGWSGDFSIAVADLKKVEFTVPRIENLNVFETTIRYLGGLLGAYEVSDRKHAILLQKAIQVGDMLYHAFDTPNRMPITRWIWEQSAYNISQESPTHALLAEIGSLSLEFTRLAQLTGDSKYYDAIQRVTNALESQQKETKIPGLWPVLVNGATMNFKHDKTFTFGGMADSTYEYLPKEFLLLGGLVPQYQDMYEQVIDAAKLHLFFRPSMPEDYDLLLSGTAKFTPDERIVLEPEVQHLGCFVGGMVAIGSKIFSRPEDLPVAQKLVEGCIWAYNQTETGIMPEIFTTVQCPGLEDCIWDEQDWFDSVNKNHKPKEDDVAPSNERAQSIISTSQYTPGVSYIKDRRYMLRPEAIESIFILYRITGDKRYQDIAWRMFVNIDAACRTPLGYSSINDVTHRESTKLDSQESFWFAETLKYLYLIFSEPDVVSLDEWVLNTEAHPFRRPKA